MHSGTHIWWYTYMVAHIHSATALFIYTVYMYIYDSKCTHIQYYHVLPSWRHTLWYRTHTHSKGLFLCCTHTSYYPIRMYTHKYIRSPPGNQKKTKKSPHTAILETQHPAKPIKKSRFVHHWPSSTLVECKHLIHILKCQLHTATHCNTLQHTATHCNTLQHPTGRPAPSANPNMSSQLHTADTNSQRSAIWSFPLSNWVASWLSRISQRTGTSTSYTWSQLHTLFSICILRAYFWESLP